MTSESSESVPHPDHPDPDAIDPDVIGPDGDDDAQAWADHDRLGTDLARQIAHRVAGQARVDLPPARGIRPRRPRRSPQNLRSGSGPDDRDPQLLGGLVDGLIRARGWTKQVSVRSLVVRWAELVGEVNGAHTRPESYDAGVLVVRADSSTWASSMRAIAPQLVAELNRRLGDGTVTRVQVLGPHAPSWKHGPRSVRDGRGPRDTYG